MEGEESVRKGKAKRVEWQNKRRGSYQMRYEAAKAADRK